MEEVLEISYKCRLNLNSCLSRPSNCLGKHRLELEADMSDFRWQM
jgi:hypothetical protein